MPRRSRSLQELERAGELEAVEGSQRVAGWPLPERVDLYAVNGEPAVVAHFPNDPATVSLANEREVRGAFHRLRMLDGASPNRVRDFVLTFGPLFDTEEWSGMGYLGLPYRAVDGVEVVSWYTELGGLLAATARLALRIRRAQRLEVQDLSIVARTLEDFSVRSFRHDYTVKSAGAISRQLAAGAGGSKVAYTDAARRIPEGVVNWWLGAKQVRPLLLWHTGDRPTVVWTGELWGAIGAQFLADVRRGGRAVECDGCGREVPRNRLPKSGQPMWCHRDGCRRMRDAEAQRRSRKRRKLRR